MICPGCAMRDAIDDDMCRECAGQRSFEFANVNPCRICRSRERNRFNQCVPCLRRRARNLYRRRHGIPLTVPLMSNVESGRLGAEARRKTA